MSCVFLPPMSIYGFSCSPFPLCSLIIIPPSCVWFLPQLFLFSLISSPVFFSLGFPHVWCPVLFVLPPCSMCVLLGFFIKRSFECSPRLLAPCSSVDCDRIPDPTKSKRCPFSPFVFSFFESFLFPLFPPAVWKPPLVSLPWPAEISPSWSIRGSSAGSPRQRH